MHIMHYIAANMPKTIYILVSYPQYVFDNGKCYRKQFITSNFQYRNKREIKISEKGGIKGFWLVRNKKRKFISLIKLRHRLKKK